jgi:hypothetical protein
MRKCLALITVAVATLAGCSDDDTTAPQSSTTATGSGGSGTGTATQTGGSGGDGGATGGSGGGGTSEANVYEVPIDLPSCAPAADVRIITTDADWDDINDPAIRVFCVHPGDYRAYGDIRLTADGTAGAERWIRWYDPDAADDTTTHPVNMTEQDRAVVLHLRVGLDGDAADHWRIDRLTVRGAPWGNLVSFGSSNNVLNRLLVEEGQSHQVTFADGATDNTLQNSVVRHTERVPDADRTCVNLAGGQIGTRIVANEIYDCAGDGIQFSPNTGYGYVENNDIYLTSDLYSDCSGNLSDSGLCACAENAIDFKSPRDRQWPLAEAEWVRIERNRMWGFRPTDSACGGTGSPGTAVAIGSGDTNAVDFVLLRDNIIMDSPGGVAIGVAPVRNISIIGNLLYDLTHARTDDYQGALTNGGDDHIEFYLNTVIDSRHWFRNGPAADENDLRCNIAIGSGGRPFSSVEWGTNSTADYNFFYDTDPYTTEDPSHDISLPTAAEAAHEPLCFERKRLTAPETYCIEHGKPTAASPHWNACDDDLGSRADIGVDDATGAALGTWPGL